jgi:Transcription-repair coupling factor (superfamily II helicase)
MTALALTVPLVIGCFLAAYYYVRFAGLIDERLHGERQTTLPRVLARPLELRRGQSLTDRQLIDRLNDLGYAERTTAQRAGEFAVGTGTVSLVPRSPEFKGQLVKVVFERPAPAAARAAAARKPPPPNALPTACCSSSSATRQVSDSFSTRRC